MSRSSCYDGKEPRPVLTVGLFPKPRRHRGCRSTVTQNSIPFKATFKLWDEGRVRLREVYGIGHSAMSRHLLKTVLRRRSRDCLDSLDRSRSPTELNYNVDANKAQRDLVMQLEAKNREIMREIQRLRLEQEKQAKVSSEVAGQQRNPTLLAELRLLRQRRDELEARMTALQESRRELMVQLEGLMKLLKVK
ncbi:hypothetical protein LSH36_456g04009 [Paralvinella palmiformis]|uniref:Uncharacterized protein n=1 Tax=Paralvinella palmiformis TaxID=53620 RepID=A0AAD9JAT7_9ANNE|nr:hypothetical protein LSH36_456g04009 [Paralvinella palmiformis]